MVIEFGERVVSLPQPLSAGIGWVGILSLTEQVALLTHQVGGMLLQAHATLGTSRR
ncbi:hypothetical protein ORV05_20575 [Amycolatopsis cynarae]|uniref:Uncharacterized protein n=1 Tax=Amycolatopsis cynarae TaxID=2995223 RepID=A0ABY7AV68_9PSEU|nr:hypothetical protein [Amycolatopsis sp. HUAS 11-8]WAL63408.1 hypothetical protein ORV05_20575 [Amycolatopsis sp. HUAS 11-8]